MVDSFRVNALGPLLLTRALLQNLRAGDRRLVVNVSTNLASLSRTGTEDAAGWYAYRASKAALNMMTRCLAAELAPEGFACVALHPGWVRTDMGGAGAPLSVEESVRGMRAVIEDLDMARSGGFRDYTGAELPW